ncbi:MAG TPA: hypothetical protein VJ755_13425 [Gemmatimonadales bacterium]|nr:hypothetical protein [Gemmatimonadales bacterium]
MQRRVLHLATIALLAGCAARISQFSPIAYEQATALKVDANALMSKATQPFADHAQEVEALNLRVAKAYEFAKGRPHNEISTRQWAILADSTRNLLGGFLARWKRESKLSPTFVSESQQLVAQAFDTIIALESGKLKPADIP